MTHVIIRPAAARLIASGARASASDGSASDIMRYIISCYYVYMYVYMYVYIYIYIYICIIPTLD